MSTPLPLQGFCQNAYVTHDLDRAVAIMTERHGLRDWVYFEPEMEVYTATDGHGPCKLKVALAWADNLQVELIQPIWGNLRHYLEYLPADGTDVAPRFHHICMRVDNWDSARASLAAANVPVAYEGGVEGCRFVYIDARESFGHYVEYMWMSPELWAANGGK